MGGGITGLVAARALARRGHAVTLLEQGRRLGGKIRTEHVDGFVIEAGPDSFLARKRAALDLCRELELAGELVAASEPRRVRVHARDTLHPLPEGIKLVPTQIEPIERSGLFTTAEAARIAQDLVLPAASPVEDESLASLIRRRMGQAALDRLVAPLLAGIHAADPERLSVRATFPALARAEQEWGSLMRGLGRSADGSPFVTLAGGLGDLVERLVARSHGAELRTATAVTGVERTAHGYRLDLGSGAVLRADALILAVPAPEAARLLAPLAPGAASLLEGIRHVSTAVVTLGYRAREIPPLDGHGFVVARDQPSAITACTWTSAKWPGRAPEGFALIRAHMGSAVRPLDPEACDAQLIGGAREALATAMGLTAEPVLVQVARWPDAIPQYDVGHRERIDRVMMDVARSPRLAVAGAALRGSGLPDCIGQGVAAAEWVANVD